MRTLEEKIEDYLSGNLSSKEQEEFNLKLNSDDSLRQEIEAHRLVEEAIVDHELIQLRGELKKIIDQKPRKNRGNNNTKRFIFGVGALVLCFSLLWTVPWPEDNSVLQSVVPPEGNDQIILSESLAVSKEKTFTDPIPKELPDTSNSATIVLEKPKAISSETAQIPKVNDLPRIPLTKKEHIAPNLGDEISALKPTIKVLPIELPKTKNELDENYDAWLVGRPTVIDKCNYGLIVLPSQWTRALMENEITIASLPDSIDIVQDTLHNIPPGVQTLLVATTMEPTQQVKVDLTIYGDQCQEDKPQVFSPQKGDVWTFITIPETEGRVEIMDKNGYQIKAINFNSGEKVIWDGYRSDGNMAGLGLYFYIIRYQDQNQAINGSLYLIR